MTYKARRQILALTADMRRQQRVRPQGVQKPRDDIVEEGWLAGARVVPDGCFSP
jgi:hypothetical protein